MIGLLLVEAVEAAPLLDALSSAVRYKALLSVIPCCWIWNVIFSSMQRRRLASSMLRNVSERHQ